MLSGDTWQLSSSGQVHFNQPAICSGDQRALRFVATMRANARLIINFQGLGRCARTQVASSARLAR